MPGMIDTCNEALAEIKADGIQSVDEDNPQARECKRFYGPTLSDMLALHEWGFAIKRATLAMKINDRLGEWGYAYAKPSDCDRLRRIMPLYDGSNPINYPVWGCWRHPAWGNYQVPFIEDAGTIYTMIDLAVAEYSSGSVPDTQLPPLFRRALVHELASRLAMPIRGDRQLKGDQIQLASAARAVAMADDQNRYPRTQPEYMSDVERVRHGGYVSDYR